MSPTTAAASTNNHEGAGWNSVLQQQTKRRQCQRCFSWLDTSSCPICDESTPEPPSTDTPTVFRFGFVSSNTAQPPVVTGDPPPASAAPAVLFGFNEAGAPPNSSARFTFGRTSYASSASPPNNTVSGNSSLEGGVSGGSNLSTPAVLQPKMQLLEAEKTPPCLRDMINVLNSYDSPTDSVCPAPSQRIADVDEVEGSVYTWGSGECDQLALHSTLLNEFNCCEYPQLIKKLSKPECLSISCGAMHSLALLRDGRVLSWGCGDNGVLGRPLKQAFPVWNEEAIENLKSQFNLSVTAESAPLLHVERVPSLVLGLPLKVTKLSCGMSHCACILSDGTVWQWGSYRDTDGLIGFPLYRSSNKPSVLLSRKSEHPPEVIPVQYYPVRVEGIEGVCVSLVSGENHTGVFVIDEKDRNRIYLWGSNEMGQLGKPLIDTDILNNVVDINDEKEVDSFLQKVRVKKQRFLYPSEINIDKVMKPHYPDVDGVLSARLALQNVFMGLCTTFIVCNYKSLSDFMPRTFGCGRNCCGEVGIGYISNVVSQFEELKSIRGLSFLDIRGGSYHTVGLGHESSIFTWGSSECVGQGSTGGNVTEPKILSGLKNRVSKIGASQDTGYCITSDGLLFGWGGNQQHQLVCTQDNNNVLRPSLIDPRLFNNSFVLDCTGGAQHCAALVVPKIKDPNGCAVGLPKAAQQGIIETQEALLKREKRQRAEKRVRDEIDTLDNLAKRVKLAEAGLQVDESTDDSKLGGTTMPTVHNKYEAVPLPVPPADKIPKSATCPPVQDVGENESATDEPMEPSIPSPPVTRKKGGKATRKQHPPTPPVVPAPIVEEPQPIQVSDLHPMEGVTVEVVDSNTVGLPVNSEGHVVYEPENFESSSSANVDGEPVQPLSSVESQAEEPPPSQIGMDLVLLSATASPLESEQEQEKEAPSRTTTTRKAKPKAKAKAAPKKAAPKAKAKASSTTTTGIITTTSTAPDSPLVEVVESTAAATSGTTATTASKQKKVSKKPPAAPPPPAPNRPATRSTTKAAAKTKPQEPDSSQGRSSRIQKEEKPGSSKAAPKKSSTRAMR